MGIWREVRGQKRLVAGSLILALGAVISIGLTASGPEEYPTEGPAPAARRELESVLGELRRTWRPGEKAGILAMAADRIDELRSPLLGLLSEPAHPLIPEAVELAAALYVRQAHPALVKLATSGPESLRPVAIAAADGLEPWSREDLAEFLREDTPPVVLAALDVSSLRDERPFLEIIDLFGHEDPEIREAASEAIPYNLKPEILEELLAVARNATEDRVFYAIRALRRTRPVAKVEMFLVEQLDVPDPSLRMAALDALSAKGSSLAQPAAVWNLVLDPGEEPIIQAAALYCLERTGSFTTEQIRERLPLMGTLTRYFAARCLLTEGQKDGLGVLLDLETQRCREGFPELDTELAEALCVSIVQVVREVRGRGRIDDLNLLRDWFEKLPQVPRQKLPPAVFLNAAAYR